MIYYYGKLIVIRKQILLKDKMTVIGLVVTRGDALFNGSGDRGLGKKLRKFVSWFNVTQLL